MITTVACIGDCAQVRRATAKELATIAREWGGDLEMCSSPSDCPDCGSERIFDQVSAGEYRIQTEVGYRPAR